MSPAPQSFGVGDVVYIDTGDRDGRSEVRATVVGIGPLQGGVWMYTCETDAGERLTVDPRFMEHDSDEDDEVRMMHEEEGGEDRRQLRAKVAIALARMSEDELRTTLVRVVDVMCVDGPDAEWDSDTLMYVADALRGNGIPVP